MEGVPDEEQQHARDDGTREYRFPAQDGDPCRGAPHVIPEDAAVEHDVPDRERDEEDAQGVAGAARALAVAIEAPRSSLLSRRSSRRLGRRAHTRGRRAFAATP